MGKELKYYASERERHPGLDGSIVSPEDAAQAIGDLCEANGLPSLPVKFRDGTGGEYRRSRRRGGTCIRLGRSSLDWLTVIHEVAHYIHDLETSVDGVSRKGIRHHGRRHEELVNQLATQIRKIDWMAKKIRQANRAKAERKAEKERLFQDLREICAGVGDSEQAFPEALQHD